MTEPRQPEPHHEVADSASDPASASEPAFAGGVERTGVAAADIAADRLDELDDLPLEEHVGLFEDVHRRLQEGLADLDEQ